MKYSEEIVRVPTRPGRTIAREAADDLEQSIRRLEAWGAKVPTNSRLREAVVVLRDAATSGKRAATVLTDEPGILALRVGLDYRAIADTLPGERVAELRRDIEESCDGPLRHSVADGGPQRMQSQLVVRAALQLEGLTPLLRRGPLRAGRKRPDILLPNGSIEHPLEVKRPQKRANVLSRFNEAADQVLDAGGRGAVVVDVTDCLVGATPLDWNEEILSILKEISDSVLTPSSGYLPGRRHVVMAAVMARPSWTIKRTGLDAIAEIHSISAATSYGMAKGTLDHHRGVWIRRGISEGLNRIGFTSAEP